MDPLFASLITLVGVVVLIVLALAAVTAGNFARVGMAWQVLTRTADPALAEKVRALLSQAPVEQKPAKVSGVPLRTLGLLQREGRLLDFLMEDIQGAGDEQIGFAVREIHRQCQAALKEHLVLEPVLPQTEGDTVEVPAGFDPSAVRLTGNLTGQPPFKGTLKHAGWRVKEIKLPTPPAGQDELILMPAEVELP